MKILKIQAAILKTVSGKITVHYKGKDVISITQISYQQTKHQESMT